MPKKFWEHISNGHFEERILRRTSVLRNLIHVKQVDGFIICILGRAKLSLSLSLSISSSIMDAFKMHQKNTQYSLF